MDDAVVYLVPLGRDRYELYSEPPEDDADDTQGEGWFRTRAQRLREGWRAMVHTARRSEPGRGWLARTRDWTVCRVAETVAEQRTLWSLRSVASVGFLYPSTLSESSSADVRRRILSHARRHHGIWLVVDGVLFAASGLLVLVPGPNFVAYYFGLRVVGHFLSWRGARQGLDRIAWHSTAEPALAELAALTSVPRESRASRVEAIASRLNLPRLAAFFDRAAVPG